MVEPVFDSVGDDLNTTLGGRTSTRDLMYDAERRLLAAEVPSPHVDAAILLAWVLDVPRSRLFLQDAPTSQQRVAYERALALRLNRVPLQHIMGTAPFRRMDILVGPGVFVPRPETELVAEAGLRELRDLAEGVAVDLCAGSGAIGLSFALEAPGTTVYLVEVDQAALEWTHRNVEANAEHIARAGSVVHVVESDVRDVAMMGGALAHIAGSVDIVAANPPYIPDAMVPRDAEVREHDPAAALYAGPDGLDRIRELARTAAILLKAGGSVIVEHADQQGPDATDGGVVGVFRDLCIDQDMSLMVPGLPEKRAFRQVVDRRDLAGSPRFTIAIREDP